MTDQHIFPSPSFNVEKFSERILKETGITNGKGYGVGLTDVLEDYIDWRYKGLKIYYQDIGSQHEALQLYEALIARNFLDLGIDPLKGSNLYALNKIFILKQPNIQ